MLECGGLIQHRYWGTYTRYQISADQEEARGEVVTHTDIRSNLRQPLFHGVPVVGEHHLVEFKLQVFSQRLLPAPEVPFGQEGEAHLNSKYVNTTLLLLLRKICS